MYAHSKLTQSSKSVPHNLGETSMKMHRVLKSIVLGITCVAVVSSAADAKTWRLPRCKKDHQPQTLEIITKQNAGWTVNGMNAVNRSDVSWAQVPPSHWIGPSQDQIGTFTYVVPFSAPGPHLSMKVMATWSADNCGVSLQGGTGTALNTDPNGCYETDRDFMYTWQTGWADFDPNDLNNPNLSLTFVTTNEGSVTGLTGVFDIVAECE
jgi:hypothetical protein